MSTELSICEDRGIDKAVWNALTTSIFPGAEPQSVALAYDYCKARGLDVLKKPCHIVPMNVKDAKTGKYSWRDVIMPGIAEARITAFRTGEFAGLSEPEFGPMVEVQFGNTTHQVPEWCQITAYRFLNGEKAGFPNREYFEEAASTTKDGSLNSMWTTRKRGQLAKCAEAGALRKAFPEELGGLSTVEETQVEMRDVTNTGRPASFVRDEPINPGVIEHLEPSESAAAEVMTEPHQEAAPPDPKPEKTPAQGRQTKDRHHRDCILKDLSEGQSESGKTFWLVVVDVGMKTAELRTFSSTMAERLGGLIGESIRVTFTAGPRGTFDLEDFEVLEAQTEGGLI